METANIIEIADRLAALCKEVEESIERLQKLLN
jgi:hypothetical protein